MPACRSSHPPTLKEPKAFGEPLGELGAHLRDLPPPARRWSAMDGGPLALLRRASIIPLRAETLLFHSSKHCQSKSQEGLFLALFSVVT